VRRAAPGPQLGQGRLRVDAARAIKKLREYQLANRVGWVLEGIRAAVAAGATRIELTGDSNDVWLAWEAAPLDESLLPRLFDELVSPDSGDDMQYARLLASAVNNALGLQPSYVDVYSITGAGQAKRARYTPDVLAEPENELGEAALRQVQVSSHEPPTTIARGGLVHLRRAFGLEVLSSLFSSPPELAVALEHCQDIAVPLRVGDDTIVHRPYAAKRDALRIPLGDGLDGFIAVGADVSTEQVLEVAERGVVLARYDFEALGYPVRSTLPLRIHVNADRLPTNVSRSQVRRDVHPIATAERRARAVMPEVMVAIARETTPLARRAAPGVLATAVAGHPSGWKKVPALLQPLASLPLLKNALGDARPVEHAWRAFIHTEKAPLDRDLEPWLGEVLWAPPGDDVRLLLGDHSIDVAGMRRHTRWARLQRRAHKKFLAHARRDLVVTSQAYPRGRYKLGTAVPGSAVADELFADISGEVCIYTETTSAAIALCVDGRELERIEMASPVPFDAVVDSKLLAAGERYRGVARDSGYETVLRAVRAGVVRAAEQIALESKSVLGGDRPLLRRAALMLNDIGVAVRGPLAAVPLWRTATDDYASISQLAASDAIGVIGDSETLVPPRGRVIVRASGADREDLKRMFGKSVLSYHPAVGRPRADLRAIAADLPRLPGAAALIVHDDDLRGVIALAGKSGRYLFHCGLPLGEHGYGHELITCAVAIDDDRFLPNDKWTSLRRDSSINSRKLGHWERALLRAIASTLLGDRPAELVTPEAVALGDDNFRALAKTLETTAPEVALGPEPFGRMRAEPLFERLGGKGRVSIEQLAADHAELIHYIDRAAEPVEGFMPVLADENTAKLLGKLAGRAIAHAGHELERIERVVTARRRMDRHMEQVPRPLELASPLPTVALGERMRGIVGVTDGRPQARVFVHERPFLTLEPAVGFPLVAVVEVPPSACTVPFDSLTQHATTDIVDAMRAAVPRLVEAFAREHPELLFEAGPAQRMLSTYLQGKVSGDMLGMLRGIELFATLQGERVSLEEVESPVLVAAFGDEWLPPEPGEAPTLYDARVIKVSRPPDDRSTLLGRLHDGKVSDVTTEVLRLQARRRMSRGLLPVPKLNGVADSMKRPLSAFGALAARLGHGEVGFALTPKSTLLIHDQGQLQRTIEIDVMPAIALAVEEPHDVLDHGSMIRVAQDLAVELVRTALPAALPPPLRHNLARALLARRLPPAAIGTAPIFLRADGEWTDWPAVHAQVATVGEVWAVPPGVEDVKPLDPARLVLRLDKADIELATRNGQAIVDGTKELQLDARARKNQARRAAAALDLPVGLRTLARAELTGSTRGVVAVLAPTARAERAIYPHRAMHPFDKMDDVCRWPTVAVVEDARLVPDRTWTHPKQDDAWQQVAKAIRTASEEALLRVGEAPPGALATLRVTSELCGDVKALRDASHATMRGVLWLGDRPYTRATISCHTESGTQLFVTDGGLAVGGDLVVVSADLDLAAAVHQLCRAAHGALVLAARSGAADDDDVVTAHVAHAIAAGTLKATEVSRLKFNCFSPKPIEPRALAALLRRGDTVYAVKQRTPDGKTAFLDDGSELAKVIRVHLGERLSTDAPARTTPPKPAPVVPPRSPPVSVQRPAPVEKPKVKRAPHVLKPLLDALAERLATLAIAGITVELDENAESPMLAVDGKTLVLAGRNPRLRAVAAELLAKSLLAPSALDVLAAHAVSVLNIARSDITDASELHALGVLLARRA